MRRDPDDVKKYYVLFTKKLARQFSVNDINAELVPIDYIYNKSERILSSETMQK